MGSGEKIVAWEVLTDMAKDWIEQGYTYAKERYAQKGVDVDRAMELAAGIALSMHCWQGDDVMGCEGGGGASGGIATTGNYPGRARGADELRADIDEVVRLIPGKTKLSLHASYAELGGRKVDRDAYSIREFENWVAWAKGQGMGLDFNTTFFSHPMAESGFTMSSADKGVRDFWIEHGKRCREIGAEFTKALGERCVINHWMPDGYKDVPADTVAPRRRMIESLDAMFVDKSLDEFVLDSVESKLFGLGVEQYTVGSHELMMGYAITRKKLYTLDAGHFHPLEYISQKISSVLQYLDQVFLHVSRGVRWDSDHVILLDDELQNIMNEIIFNGYQDRVCIGLDYFDASINRIAAWVIGMRNAQKALLKALLTPIAGPRECEDEGDYAGRLALLEEAKTLPFGCIWDAYCERQGVPVGEAWLNEVRDYERRVLSGRIG